MSRVAVTAFAALAASIFVAPARAQTPPAPAAAVQPLPELAPTPPGGVAPAPVVLPSLVAQTTAAPAPVADSGHVPIARRWWFWAGLGGVAVSVIVLGILLSPREAYVGNAEPGTTTVSF